MIRFIDNTLYMKIFFIIFILILSVILQTTLFSFLDIYGVIPNLVLILSLFLTVWKRFEKVWWIILLIGLLTDLLIGLPFGLASLSLISTCWIINSFNRSIFSGIKFWIMNVLIIMGTFIYFLLLFSLSKFFQFDLIFNFKYLLIEIVYNLLISSVLYAGIKKIFR